uniref:Uncharacterized protein n=1 Tax=Seriola dumerili TaxID=41447 RepID=A0A3B4V963_SERDU
RGLPHRPLQSKLYAVPLAVLKQSDEKPEKVELSQRPRVPRVVQAYRGEAVTFVSSEALRSLPVSLRSCQYYELQLTYNNLKSEEVRGPVLPPGQDTDIFTATNLSVASTVGQVIIGQNPPRITCVVNKTNIIDSTYRNFKMEVLAGEENMVTKVKHPEFREDSNVDFSCVLEPPLSTEHQRVWSSSNVVDTVLDVCCGVGPFAIRCWPARVPMCWPNDSEPRSYRWLHKVRTFKPGRQRVVIPGTCEQELPALMKEKANVHVGDGTCLPGFRVPGCIQRLLHRSLPVMRTYPQCTCYSFFKDKTMDADVVKESVAASSGSPWRQMLCAFCAFTLPKEVLSAAMMKTDR